MDLSGCVENVIICLKRYCIDSVATYRVFCWSKTTEQLEALKYSRPVLCRLECQKR